MRNHHKPNKLYKYYLGEIHRELNHHFLNSIIYSLDPVT